MLGRGGKESIHPYANATLNLKDPLKSLCDTKGLRFQRLVRKNEGREGKQCLTVLELGGERGCDEIHQQMAWE